MNPTPIHTQPKKSALALLIPSIIIISLFILGGLAAVIFGISKLSMTMVIVMLLSVGFFSMLWLIGFIQIKAIFDGKPALSLEEGGFTLHTMDVYVPWHEIDSFTLVADVSVLKVKLKNPKEFLKRQKFPTRILLFINEMSEHHILILRLKMLAKGQTQEIIDQFYAFLAKSQGVKSVAEEQQTK